MEEKKSTVLEVQDVIVKNKSETIANDEAAPFEAGFSFLFGKISQEIHRNAVEKGFWEEVNEGEKICLCHSELSEALEAYRCGNPPSEKIDTTLAEEELADAVIRIMDFAAAQKYDLGRAIVKKMKYNRTREYKHGKKF